MTVKNKFVILWLPVLLYAGLIFAFSSMSIEEEVLPFAQADKVIHFVEYAVLGILLARAFSNSGYNMPFSKCVIISVALATIYGASDELHQYFVSTRNASPYDLMFDAIGAFFGVLLYKKRQAAKCL